ncbi:MAG: phosphoserine phosphatase SerB [Alphaproteobacteria bacterium]|jgi:phosphoserine phosphatase|nr:phosphoserine phosphatase SerB [Alphaproteobacteria bacterium]MBT5799522.1 phosphoserine phosphatase SerB [Alphaproteobacteria bacterium]
MQDLILITTSSYDAKTHDIISQFANTLNLNEKCWLAKGEFGQWAAEYTAIKKAPNLTAMRQKADILGLDINIIANHNRQKKLLLADMDSTLICGESLDEVAVKAGIGDKIAAITRQTMQGELDFNQSVTQRVALLNGLSQNILSEIIAETQLTPGAARLAPVMRKNGAFCYIVSGGFDFLTTPIAEKIGFNDSFSNRLEIKDNALTGKIIPPILGQKAKQDKLFQLCKQHMISVEDSLAIGDGANDLEMLTAAGLGIAFNGKPLLRKIIHTQLNHTDLSGLLFLQGYSASQIFS